MEATFLFPQGQDGPPGDKGDDGEPGQTVSVWSDGFRVGASLSSQVFMRSPNLCPSYWAELRGPKDLVQAGTLPPKEGCVCVPAEDQYGAPRVLQSAPDLTLNVSQS